MAPSNTAIFLTAQKTPLEVKPSIYTPPTENEIVVKNSAVAINPLEWLLQDAASIFAPWIKLPFTLGSDLSGTVYEVGPGVRRFKPGDRVLGHAVSMDKRSNKSSEGAFQEYTVLRTNLVSSIPDRMAFEDACVLPLGVSTASCGLFMKDFLALERPKVGTARGSTGKTLLVWGGSTSIGCNAIQLAVAAGYEVISTASPKNHALLKSLGASQVFDYKSPTVVSDIIAVMRTKTVAGAYSIGQGALKACIEILGSCPKGRKFIAQATFDMPAGGFPKGAKDWPGFIAGMGIFKTRMFLKQKMNGVSVKFIWGSDNMANEVGKMVYEDFLPEALALERGGYQCAPQAMVVGKGLESIQNALEVSRNGVSASKVVVSLS